MKNGKIVEIIIYLFIGYWILYIPFAQLQMAIIGRVIIGSSYCLAAIACLFAVLLVLNINRLRFRQKDVVKYLLAMIMLLSILRAFVLYNISTYEMALFIFNRLLPFIIGFSAFLFRKYIDSSRISWVFITAFIFNSGFVICQFLTKNLIWPYQFDQNGNQFFWSLNTYGLLTNDMRCPGVMTSALESSVLSIVAAIVAYYKWTSKKIKAPFFILIFVLAFITLLMSQTRNAYICFLFAAIYLLTTRFVQIKDRIFYTTALVFLFIILYVLLINGGFDVLVSDKGFFNNASSIERISIWSTRMDDFSNLSTMDKFLGAFYWQASSSRKLFFDSFYIENLFIFGIFGSIALFLSFLMIQRSIYNANETSSMFRGVMFGLLFVYGLINTPSYGVIGILIIAAALFSDSTLPKKREVFSNENFVLG